jgi:hypothetical protein
MHFDVTLLSKHLKKLNIYDALKGRLSIRFGIVSFIIVLEESQYIVGKTKQELKINQKVTVYE